MSQGGNEVEAAVNSVVNNVSTIESTLIMEVALKLVINVADNGTEATGGRRKRLNLTPRYYRIIDLNKILIKIVISI